MPRYIDADVLIAKCKAIINDKWNEQAAPASWANAYADFIDDIENVPTADVEPVRHGHWIDGNCGDYVCPVCGWAFSSELPYMARKYDAETEEIMRYCMHCGAKMDKEV